MECSDPHTQVKSRVDCRLPHYPCYDEKKNRCYSIDGREVLNPVGDVLRDTMKLAKRAYDLGWRDILGLPLPSSPVRRQADEELAERIDAYGPTLLNMVPSGFARRTRPWGPYLAPPIQVAGPQAALTQMRNPIIRASEGGPLPPRFYNPEDLEEQIRTGRQTVGEYLRMGHQTLMRGYDMIQHALRPRRYTYEIPRRPRLQRLPSEELGGKIGRARKYQSRHKRSYRRKHRRKHHKTRSKLRLRRKHPLSRKKRKRKYRRSRKR